MLKNWTAQLDTSASLSISPLSLLHAYPYSKISETLSFSQTCLRISLTLMPQKKATSDALVTSPPKNECEPTVFHLPTQMWLDLVIKFMNFFFFVWFLCQRSSLCFIYSTKNYLFLSLLFLFLNLIHLLLNVFEIFIMGMKPSTSRVCVCVNGQGLAGGDFVRLCPLMPMFGCWVYQFLVLCYLFSFH